MEKEKYGVLTEVISLEINRQLIDNERFLLLDDKMINTARCQQN